MAKLTITNNNDVAIRFFDGKEQQVDIAAGATATLDIASGSIVIDMTPTAEAAMQAFAEFAALGSLGG